MSRVSGSDFPLTLRVTEIVWGALVAAAWVASAAAMRGMPVATPALRMPAALTKVRREISPSEEVSADSVSRSSSSSGGEHGELLIDFASRAVSRAEVIGHRDSLMA